ncbi:MAG: efflux RND transporter periplasmic adaptor subunit [Alphaproteobacteria bacterium]|nr:efflux RND transporter periplasmic adaptor subunit [Alphaproteobacteria bacterium]
MALKTPHKTALAIFVLSVLWMASGLIGDDHKPAKAKRAEGGPARVRVETVTGQNHTRAITVLGRTEAVRAVTVRAEVTGRVVEILADKGAWVEADQPLVRLDHEDRAQKLAEAEARLEQAEIAHQSARKLSKGGYSSQLNVAQTKADLESAHAQVTRQRRDLANTTVKAPFAGVVDDLPLEVGDYLDKEGAKAARILDLRAVIAVGQVSEMDIAHVAVGGDASIRLSDGRELSGRVTFVAKSSDAATRTFRVELAADTPDHDVAEGLTAELHIPTGEVMAHRLSPALLTLNDAGALGLKTVDDEGLVRFVAVELVADTPEGIWLSGLPQTARVISVGQEFVVAGQKVEAVHGALDTTRPNGALGE